MNSCGEESSSRLPLGNLLFRIVDLGEDNDRRLKSPEELQAERAAAAAGRKETVEAAEMVTTEMAENAGENPPKVGIEKTFLSNER